MRTRTPFIISVLTISIGAAAVLGQGSKTVLDTRKHCQLTVPVDWSVEGTAAYSPGRKIVASVNGVIANQSFADAKTTVKGIYPPVKVIQDDAKRLLYSFDPGIMGAGKSGWFEVINSTPTCGSSLMFAPGTDEALLRKIADSLAPVKQ